MTSVKRFDLMERGDLIVFAANEKLRLPENGAKGDEWDQIPLPKLLKLLHDELAEFIEAAEGMEFQLHHFGDVADIQKHELLQESGDILNILRFICDRYGAI